MKVSIPASVPHVKTPSAPPVETMYFSPPWARSGTLAEANLAPAVPAQLSLPHSPVAKARVTVFSPAAASSVAMGVKVPVILVEMTFVLKFILMLVSLYELKTSEAGAVPVAPPVLGGAGAGGAGVVGDGVGADVGAGAGAGAGTVAPEEEQLVT